MQRREFSLLAASGATVGLMSQTSAWAQKSNPQEGTDYLALDRRVAVDAPAGKVEVIEFFWYSCPHCNAFEPTLDAWIKKLPADVAFKRVPVAFRDDFVPQQRLYYVLEAMGKVEELHKKVFHAVHTEKQQLAKEDAILAWVEKQGVDKAKFQSLYNSFAITAKASRATQLQQSYKVDGVPSLGVAGRFYTDGAMNKSMERALQVVEYLVAEVRKSR